MKRAVSWLAQFLAVADSRKLPYNCTCDLVSCFEYLERAESDEAFGDPADHRAPFAYLVAVIVRVSGYEIVTCYAAGCSCGRYAEMVHRLRAQEFADT